MNNISEHKLLFHTDRIAGDKKPITADVFINNYCNLRCPFCTYSRWELEEGARFMNIDKFKEVCDRLIQLGVKGIILTGGGEPTLNPDFYEITKYLELNNISYGINTGFTNYREFSPSYIKVSLDGYDRESYKAIKGVDKYDDVVDNIRRFAEWKKVNSPNTVLGIQKIVTDINDIKKFYDANKNLDVDYIVYRPIESTQGCYYSDSKDADIVKIQKEIKRIKDKRVIINYKWSKIREKFDKCYAHWAQIAVNEKGEVMYCCHKPYEIICNLMDENVLKKYEDARTDMTKCDVPCRLTAPNELIKSIECISNSNFI